MGDVFPSVIDDRLAEWVVFVFDKKRREVEDLVEEADPAVVGLVVFG